MRLKELYKVLDTRHVCIADSEIFEWLARIDLGDDIMLWLDGKKEAQRLADEDEYIVTKVSLVADDRPFIFVEVKKDDSKT